MRCDENEYAQYKPTHNVAVTQLKAEPKTRCHPEHAREAGVRGTLRYPCTSSGVNRITRIKESIRATALISTAGTSRKA